MARTIVMVHGLWGGGWCWEAYPDWGPPVRSSSPSPAAPLRKSASCPVLVIAGTEDRITPASVVRQVARKYKAVAHWLDRLPAGARSETTHTV